MKNNKNDYFEDYTLWEEGSLLRLVQECSYELYQLDILVVNTYKEFMTNDVVDDGVWYKIDDYIFSDENI